MTESQLSLWERLEQFSIDAGDEAFTFSKRLARENGWSHTFAQRVILEYKKFVFLCMEAGHACTPSDHVDQAWHLHLTYTQSYWEEMCQKVLPRPLHHNPTKGGATEDEKFDDWYARTIESYERFFGAKPPEDIWPPSELRFGVDPYAQRVNLKRYWVIPKRPLKRGAGLAALGAVALVAVGCTQYDAVAGLICGGGVLVMLLIAGYMSSSRRGRGSGSGCSGAGCGAGGCSGSNHSGCGGSSGCGSGGDGGGGGCGGGGCGGGGCGS